MTTLTWSEREAIAYANGQPSEALAALADRDYMEDNVGSAIGYIQESCGSMPGEDFLRNPIKALQNMAGKSRGDNRSALLHVVAMLEDIQSTQAHSTEYGLEQLSNALKQLGE